MCPDSFQLYSNSGYPYLYPVQLVTLSCIMQQFILAVPHNEFWLPFATKARKIALPRAWVVLLNNHTSKVLAPTPRPSPQEGMGEQWGGLSITINHNGFTHFL